MKDTYTPKSLRIRLDAKTSQKISDFWEKNGCFRAAMMAQPVKRGKGYTLKIRMFSPSQSERLDALILELRHEQEYGKDEKDAQPE